MFWRIFLVLWLVSTALMIGSAVALALVAEREMPNQMRTGVVSILQAAARPILLMRERVPPDEFRETLRTLREEHDFDLYLVDADGREALGRRVPDAFDDLAARARDVPLARLSGPPPGGELVYAERTTDARGRPLLVLMRVPGPPFPGRAFLLANLIVPLSFSVVLASLFSAMSARYLVAPIEHLRMATRRLASGALDYRIGHLLTRRNDEFGALAADFDGMADRIAALVANQRTLMLDLSHELRSPLARLRVALELQRGDAPRPDLLDRMERDTERMDRLIGELLALARLETHRVSPDVDRLELGALVGDIVQDARLEIAGTERRLDYVAGHVPLYVQGDAETLRRAVENLLRNALQHTPEQAAVQVRIERIGDEARIEVCDEGPGYDADILREPFVPFMRGDSAGRHRGNGLGLAIVRAAILHHRGSVELRNREGGRGACADIRLPCCDAGPGRHGAD